MSFSNIARQQKTVTVGGVTCVLKKYPRGFMSWALIKGLEGRDIDVETVPDKDEKGNPKDRTVFKRVRSAGRFEDEVEINIARVLNGTSSWDLKDDKGKVADLTEATVRTLWTEVPEFVDMLITEIEAFNVGLSPKNE